MNNERLILRALKEILERTCPDGECLPVIWNDIDDTLNPKKEQSLPDKTEDALRGE